MIRNWLANYLHKAKNSTNYYVSAIMNTLLNKLPLYINYITIRLVNVTHEKKYFWNVRLMPLKMTQIDKKTVDVLKIGYVWFIKIENVIIFIHKCITESINTLYFQLNKNLVFFSQRNCYRIWKFCRISFSRIISFFEFIFLVIFLPRILEALCKMSCRKYFRWKQMFMSKHLLCYFEKDLHVFFFFL